MYFLFHLVTVFGICYSTSDHYVYEQFVNEHGEPVWVKRLIQLSLNDQQQITAIDIRIRALKNEIHELNSQKQQIFDK